MRGKTINVDRHWENSAFTWSYCFELFRLFPLQQQESGKTKALFDGLKNTVHWETTVLLLVQRLSQRQSALLSTCIHTSSQRIILTFLFFYDAYCVRCSLHLYDAFSFSSLYWGGKGLVLLLGYKLFPFRCSLRFFVLKLKQYFAHNWLRKW